MVVVAILVALGRGGTQGASAGPAATPAVTLALRAKGIAFSTLSLEVPANAPFAIRFANDDPVPHDVDIRAADGTTTVVHQENVAGGSATIYEYPSLAPGRYLFICSVHPIPAMTGTLVVK